MTSMRTGKDMTEKDWSERLTKKLRENKCFVQRIESGSTGRGIPDMFVIIPNLTPVWIENKIVTLDKNTISRIENGIECKVKIPWRPGQLAWHKKVYKAMTVLTVTRITNTTKYVLVTPFNWSIGGPKDDIMKGYATVKMYNPALYWGVGTNDTMMMPVDGFIEFFTGVRWI